MAKRVKRYLGPDNQSTFTAPQLGKAYGMIRAVGDKGFPQWADEELKALKGGRTTVGPPSVPNQSRKKEKLGKEASKLFGGL